MIALLLLRPKKYSALTLSGNEVTDAVRMVGASGDGRLNDQSFGVWPAATNLLTAPADFSNAAWVLDNGSKTSTTEIDPGGGATGILATFTLSGDHRLRQAKTVTASTTYVWSFWAKRGTMTALRYSVYDNTHSADIVAPTSYYSQTNSSAYAQITVAFTTPAGCTSISVYCSRDETSTGTAWFAWPQLETGSVATPFTPTSRAAARVQAPASLLNATQGWVAMRVRMGYASTATLASDTYFFNLWTDGSNRLGVFRGNGGANLGISRYNSAVGSAPTFSSSAWSLGDYVTIIAKWTATGLTGSRDGAAFAAPTGNTNIPSISNFEIGSYQAAGVPATSTCDFLWFACGTGTLSDGDAAYLHSFGNNKPSLAQLPGNPTGLWDCKSGWMQVLA